MGILSGRYSDIYAMLFDGIRRNVRNVTEVGVQDGYSLRAWHDYFEASDMECSFPIRGLSAEKAMRQTINEHHMLMYKGLVCAVTSMETDWISTFKTYVKDM